MRLPLILFSVIMLCPVWTFAGEHSETKAMPKVTNETYKKNCGTCHFAYQPGLLPARSWSKIIDSPDGHPGGKLALDSKTKADVKKYLTENSAESSPSKRSKKIMASINSDAPTRISEVPYIKKKHHEIKQEVFTRKSIGSRGNCIACHRTAESGDYDDKHVKIPK